MADDSFNVWWKTLWEDNKVFNSTLKKNINEIKDNSNGTTNIDESTSDDSPKAKRMKVNESHSQLYDSIDNGEVNELLDKAYQDKSKINLDETVNKDNIKVIKKTVLKKETRNYYDNLPENWIKITHKSGTPIYLDTKSRTVLFTRPYFLGSDDPELHILPTVPPLSALSCSLRENVFETIKTIINDHDFQTSKLDNMIMPTAKVENTQENIIEESFFKLKKLNASLEQSSPQHTSSENVSIQTHSIERPLLPESNKITSFPVQSKDHDNQCKFQEWVLHQYGKSYVYVLNEYLLRIFKIKPFYDLNKIENSETPYSAGVILKHIYYGVGFSYTKKQAKLNAARATLHILIPTMKNKIDSDQQIFNQLEITDPRVTFYCETLSKHCPYDMLLLCLQRNFRDYEVNYRYKGPRGTSNVYCMKVGQHAVYVNCENKEDGKQIASQTMLSLLHPPINYWSSLLCLYDGLKLKKNSPQMESHNALLN